MCMYALSKQPLISGLQAVSQAKQGWFADHAPGCESLQDIRVWWDELIVARPDLGYYPIARNCWLVIKPGKEGTASEHGGHGKNKTESSSSLRVGSIN